MGFKSVAVLDVRSCMVTAIVGEEGVNRTFVFKGSQSATYAGYENGKLYDEAEFKNSVFSALTAAEQSANERLKTVYVSIPSEFTKIVNENHLISFSSPKRITNGDVETLFREGYGKVEEDPSYEKIHASAFFFTTADSRKVTDPTGIISSSLQGNVCYILADCRFLASLRAMLKEYGFRTVRFVPSSYMQVKYLLDEKERAQSAILLDVGTAYTTVSIAYGDGVLCERNFAFGEGDMLAALMQRFDWSYERAAEELKHANLFRRSKAGVSHWEEGYVAPEEINEVITAQLDYLCEPLGEFLEYCPSVAANRPIFVTGEGVAHVSGCVEHLSNRINREAEIIVPSLPYYNKPSMSSRISLLDYAVRRNKAEGFFGKLFK